MLKRLERAFLPLICVLVSPVWAADTVNLTFGAIPPGKSSTVTIQANVVGSPATVSNQATISGTNFTSVLSDDPGVGGAADVTVLTLCPTISLGALPNGIVGTAYASSATASGGTGPYTYALTSGALPTNLSRTDALISGNPTVAGTYTFQITATDTSGAGTCTGSRTYTVYIGSSVAAGDLVIREFRLRGTAGIHDEFVEVFNRSTAPITIAATDGSSGYGIVSEGAGLLVTIPNGTAIPLGGAFLAANNTATTGYSLTNYGGPGGGTQNASWTTDVADNSGLGVFRSASTYDTTTRVDAVGYTTSGTLYREGTGLTTPISTGGEFVFVRKAGGGYVQDTGDNASDFLFVSTDAGTYSAQSALGSPGPQNLTSMRDSGGLSIDLADPAAGVNSAPNRVQTGSYPYFRRKVTNNTGGTINKVRFRLVDTSTLNSPGYGGTQADMRGITSSDVVITLTDTSTPTAKGLTLEAPSVAFAGATGKGMGYNSSFLLNVGSVPNGNFFYINIGFRQIKGGTFNLYISPEVP